MSDRKAHEVQDFELGGMLSNDANNCFVCGPQNPIGLRVRFFLEKVNDEIICQGLYTTQDHYVGFNNVTHGGIVFSLLDDVMANWMWLQNRHAYTAKASIRYKAELPISTPVRLIGRCIKQKGRLAEMEGKIEHAEHGKLYAQASASFMVANEKSN